MNAKRTSLNERGITLGAVIIIAIASLIAAGVGVIIYNVISSESGDIDDRADAPRNVPSIFMLDADNNLVPATTASPNEQLPPDVDSPDVDSPNVGHGLTQISGVYEHTCAISNVRDPSLAFNKDVSTTTAGNADTTGSLWCWGRTDRNSLPSSSPSPFAIASLTGVQSVATGQVHTCVIVSGGNVKCFGNNSDKQLGVASPSSSTIPVDVAFITDAKKLALGSERIFNVSSCAIVGMGTPETTDDEIRCWGRRNARIGQASGAGLAEPVTIMKAGGALIGVIDLAIGNSNGCAVVTGGDVWCWGTNNEAQLGRVVTGTSSMLAQQVPGITDVVEIVVGEKFVCARNTAVWCWGRNDLGELGEKPASLSSPDTKIHIPQEVAGTQGATALATADDLSFTCAITQTGATRCWGENGAKRGIATGFWRKASTIPSASEIFCINAFRNNFFEGDDCVLGVTNNANGFTAPIDIPFGVIAVEIAVLEYGVCIIGADKKVHCAGNSANRAGRSNKIGPGIFTNLNLQKVMGHVCPSPAAATDFSCLM